MFLLDDFLALIDIDAFLCRFTAQPATVRRVPHSIFLREGGGEVFYTRGTVFVVVKRDDSILLLDVIQTVVDGFLGSSITLIEAEIGKFLVIGQCRYPLLTREWGGSMGVLP